GGRARRCARRGWRHGGVARCRHLVLRRHGARRRIERRPARDRAICRGRGPDADLELRRDPRPGNRLPAPHRPEGDRGMTVQTAAVAPAITSGVRGRPFLGFGTFLRKELTEWARGRGALVIAGISIFGAIFTTIIPF